MDYEYLVGAILAHAAPEAPVKKLNELGSQGWDLVSAVPHYRDGALHVLM